MLCCALVLAAPAPPEPPAITEEAAAIMQRTTDLVVRDTRAWQRDHGDQTIPWDEAEGHLAIVIDDVGRELHLFEQLLALRHPLTFSVLPGSIYALGVQLRLRGDARRPREIMLHLPMEPGDPGMMVAGAEADEAFLLRADSPAARRAKLEAALSRVPAAVGVNNHMGSALTPDPAARFNVLLTMASPCWSLPDNPLYRPSASAPFRSRRAPASIPLACSGTAHATTRSFHTRNNWNQN